MTIIWVTNRPISNARFTLGIGEQIPARYTSADSLKQLKEIHGEDAIRPMTLLQPVADLQTQRLIVLALQEQTEILCHQLEEHCAKATEQEKRIEALEKALTERSATP